MWRGGCDGNQVVFDGNQVHAWKQFHAISGIFLYATHAMAFYVETFIYDNGFHFLIDEA